MKRLLFLPLILSLWGCAALPLPGTKQARSAETDLAVLRRQLEDIHGSRDVAAFGALHMEDVVFEWRGRPMVLSGRLSLENSQRELWANRRELRLTRQVSDLRIHADRADESGTYEETWINPQGSRVTEFGRYTTIYARGADGQWRIARTTGFTDVTATSKATD